jgi:hypothetical protein
MDFFAPPPWQMSPIFFLCLILVWTTSELLFSARAQGILSCCLCQNATLGLFSKPLYLELPMILGQSSYIVGPFSLLWLPRMLVFISNQTLGLSHVICSKFSFTYRVMVILSGILNIRNSSEKNLINGLRYGIKEIEGGRFLMLMWYDFLGS